MSASRSRDRGGSREEELDDGCMSNAVCDRRSVTVDAVDCCCCSAASCRCISAGNEATAHRQWRTESARSTCEPPPGCTPAGHPTPEQVKSAGVGRAGHRAPESADRGMEAHSARERHIKDSSTRRGVRWAGRGLKRRHELVQQPQRSATRTRCESKCDNWPGFCRGNKPDKKRF